jgi:RNA:NAD 2'-phosphotransferase (TPT1/KptA family)
LVGGFSFSCFTTKTKDKGMLDMEMIILIIKSKEAWNNGIAFYGGNDKVWLTDYMPIQ